MKGFFIMNNQMDFVPPNLYDKFLSEMGEDGEFIIENTGIILYSKTDLAERNTTYQIEEWEPDFFMIGQDGDLAFFIKKDSDDTIYMNDLGALGSIEMKRTASDVYEFVKYSGEDFDQGVNDDESRGYNEMFKVHKFEK